MRKFLLLVISLAGTLCCTRIDFAVNWADTYMVSKVDDYFDLNSAQSKKLKTEVKDDIRKIRKTMFPGWAVVLRNFAQEVQKNTLTKEKFHTFFVQCIDASQKVQASFSASAVQLVASANPAQLQHFEETVRKKNVEDQEKVQDSQKARDEARKKYLRWTEMWVNSLTKDQEQLLNRHLDEHPFPLEAQINNKNQALEKFKQAQKDPKALETYVRDFTTDLNSVRSPEYQKALVAYQQELEKFIYQLLTSLNDKQKKQLIDNLNDKAASLDRLSALKEDGSK